MSALSRLQLIWEFPVFVAGVRRLSGLRSRVFRIAKTRLESGNVVLKTTAKAVNPKHAFLVQGEDDVGAIVDLHQRLSSAGINVHAANGVSAGSSRFGYVLWVKPQDYERAARALGV